MAEKGAKRPAVAASTANDHLARCLKRGGDPKKCEKSAIKLGLFASNRGRRKS